MLNIQTSAANNPSGRFVKRDRADTQTNIDWITEGLRNSDFEANTYLLLVGGVSTVHFRVRAAQSHARHDLTPSDWSHVAVIDRRAANVEDTLIYEISLEPRTGFGYPTPTNAVQRDNLDRYVSTAAYPNIAVVCVPIGTGIVLSQLKVFERQRATLDALELLVLWLSFVWGVGRAGNPLLEGQGLPSATLVEFLLAASGFELTPGLASRSSCPEAIWQAARWWHQYYDEQNRPSLSGSWHKSHRYVIHEGARTAQP